MKILDQQRQSKMKKSDKKANNVKWQLMGVLDEYNLPRKDAHTTNFGFKAELDEIDDRVKQKKAMD